jgi:glyoxylase-like metal-dependent hydrolase (beta-lactamase superfamily II)
MTLQLSLEERDLASTTEAGSGTLVIAQDLAYLRLSIVNVVFLGDPVKANDWVLIDTGLPTSRNAIVKAAEHRFGRDARPSSIIMTHGHFDHAGSLEALARHWDVPVYAHPLEFPYLNGQSSYLPADAFVGGGAMALLSPLFPRSPVNVGPWLKMLPADQSVPEMPEWKWLHTPGHAPGHVSLWRESDRTLIAGDAIVTTGQESIYEALTQKPEMHGPPRYLTPDWDEAEQSVRLLAKLEPDLVISGHGRPMKGEHMRQRLHELAVKRSRFPKGGLMCSTRPSPAKAAMTPIDEFGPMIVKLRIEGVSNARTRRCGPPACLPDMGERGPAGGPRWRPLAPGRGTAWRQRILISGTGRFLKLGHCRPRAGSRSGGFSAAGGAS